MFCAQQPDAMLNPFKLLGQIFGRGVGSDGTTRPRGNSSDPETGRIGVTPIPVPAPTNDNKPGDSSGNKSEDAVLVMALLLGLH